MVVSSTFHASALMKRTELSKSSTLTNVLFGVCPLGLLDTDMSSSRPWGGMTLKSAGKYAFDQKNAA